MLKSFVENSTSLYCKLKTRSWHVDYNTGSVQLHVGQYVSGKPLQHPFDLVQASWTPCGGLGSTLPALSISYLCGEWLGSWFHSRATDVAAPIAGLIGIGYVALILCIYYLFIIYLYSFIIITIIIYLFIYLSLIYLFVIYYLLFIHLFIIHLFIYSFIHSFLGLSADRWSRPCNCLSLFPMNHAGGIAECIIQTEVAAACRSAHFSFTVSFNNSSLLMVKSTRCLLQLFRRRHFNAFEFTRANYHRGGRGRTMATKFAPQNFDHFLVLDFEATCQEGERINPQVCFLVLFAD